MNHLSAVYSDAEGHPLAYHCWEASTEGYDRVVLFVHGLGLHADAYPTVAPFFLDRRYKVYAPDLYGFGESSGDRGTVDSFYRWVENVDRLYTRILQEEGYRETVLVGHSLGALVCLALAGRHRDQDLRVVAVSPLLSSPWLTDPQVSGLKSEDLTGDDEAQAVLERDPLVVRSFTPELRAQIAEAARSLRNRDFGFPRVKCLLIHGDFDHLAPVEEVSSAFDGLGFRESRRFTFPKVRHNPLDKSVSGHVYEAVDRWLAETMYD